MLAEQVTSERANQIRTSRLSCRRYLASRELRRHRGELLVRDDPKLIILIRLLCRSIVEHRHALSAFAIQLHSPAVEHNQAGVDRVLQHRTYRTLRPRCCAAGSVDL